MEIKGVVHKVLEPVSGESARGPWMKQDVVVEQPGEYPKMVCLTFWGDRAEEAGRLQEGQMIEASINVESREYEGRWYTDVRAWRFQVVQPQAQGQQAPQQAPPFAPPMPEAEPWNAGGGAKQEGGAADEDKGFDDLPF